MVSGKLDYASGVSKEWLVANGLGGYASSTAIGANTRKYHGLLVAALRPPAGRRLLVSKLEERVFLDEIWHGLSTNKWLDGTVHPAGYEHMEGFEPFPIPTFRYALPGAKLKKEIFAVHGSNASVARYTVEPEKKLRVEMAPLVNNRGIHENAHKAPAYEQKSVKGGRGTVLDFGDGSGGGGDGTRLALFSDAMQFRPGPLVFRDMFYDVEAGRGQDAVDTHACPGNFSIEVPAGRKTVFSLFMAAIWAGAGLREDKGLYEPAAPQHRTNDGDGFAKALASAARSFIVSGRFGKTIVAGYHWFGEWGRDAMIALPGLTLETGRLADAGEILGSFARRMQDGLIPDFCSEEDGSPAHGSADASLWFVNSAYLYMKKTGDESFVRSELWPAVRNVVRTYSGGTGFGAKEDGPDGLITVTPEGRTWMDAFVDGRAVTPRNGKPVEVNALWHNALRIAALMEKRFDSGGDEKFREKAEKTGRSFRDKFWNENAGCLYDTIEPENGSVRPNQVIALSLPFRPPLPLGRAKMTMETVRNELLTPAGLRSLSSKDPEYRGKYSGPLKERDAAYHQGTVWPWLIGPFADACSNLGMKPPDLNFLEEFAIEHGTIPEIFEGDTLRPDGCISQAWSVAEVLRAYLKTAQNNRDYVRISNKK